MFDSISLQALENENYTYTNLIGERSYYLRKHTKYLQL